MTVCMWWGGVCLFSVYTLSDIFKRLGINFYYMMSRVLILNIIRPLVNVNCVRNVVLNRIHNNESLYPSRHFTKIYTRTGDKGKTSTFTGERRLKTDDIFEALGSVDELSSSLGVAREFIADLNSKSLVNVQLEEVQCTLQDLAGAIATPKSSARESHLKITSFDENNVAKLEKWIDSHSESLPELKNFILPSGGKSSSHLHLARTISRRAERRVVPLVQTDQVDKAVLKYLNRLSDYLFTAARVVAKEEGFSETIYRKNDPK